MRDSNVRRALCALALFLTVGPAWGGDWTRFRGANGRGFDDTAALPEEIGPEQNVVWRSEAPFGRSSPVIGGDRIFLTAIEGDLLLTLAYDRATGRELWRKELERSRADELHRATDSATPSPVTDGTNVYVFFHDFGLASYDGAGKERWRIALGPFLNFYGMASSPVLAGERLYLLCDQAEGSFLLAVDKDSGEELWRVKRPARLENYATPVVYPDGDAPTTLLVLGSRWVDAYDLATGKVVWSGSGVGAGPVASPVLGGDRIFVAAPDHAENGWAPFGPILEEHDADGDGKLTKQEVAGTWMESNYGWLDGDGSGAISPADWQRLADEMVTDSWGLYALRINGGDRPLTEVWNYRKNVAYIPSPILYRGVLYMPSDGILTSFDPETGEVLKRGRLKSAAQVYASPVAADGKVYLSSTEGSVTVLAAAGEWSVLAENDLGEEIYATPAIADGRLYVRTRGSLYAFAQAAPKEAGGTP